MGDEMTTEDDTPMELSEETPVGDDDDQTTGEGSNSDAAAGDGDEDRSTAVDEEDEIKSASSATKDEPDEEKEDDEESKSVGTAPEEEEEEEETKSVGTSAAPDETEIETNADAASPSPDSTPSTTVAPKKKRGKPQIPASARKGRAPAVKGLNIPFRTVKKAMKLDPDIPIVQNEAAIMTTLAAELFLTRLANQSQKICKSRGKNTIRYEDVADARAQDPALAFLKQVIP